MKFPARIEVKSTVMLGTPCVKGTRIPAYLLLEKMAAGKSFEQLLAAYPQLATWRTCGRVSERTLLLFRRSYRDVSSVVRGVFKKRHHKKNRQRRKQRESR
jgi:hypothetical protein